MDGGDWRQVRSCRQGVITLIAVVLAAFLSPVMAKDGCIVSGRVVDERGKPVPFAAVTAGKGVSSRAVNGATATNTGEYCIRELAAGTYFIRAFARSNPPAASPDCSTCCGPSSELELRSAPRVSVETGRTASGVNVTMRRVPAYCVRGELRGFLGTLPKDVVVTIERDSWSASVIVDGGRFLLTSLPAGSYTIVVHDQRQLGRVLARRVVAVTTANVTGVVITVPDRLP